MEALIGKGKLSSLILAWFFLTSTAPFIFFRWPGHPYKILTFLCLAVMVLQLAMYYKNKMFDLKIFGVLLIQISYYLVIIICYNDFTSFNLIIQLISLFILITYIRFFVGFKFFAKSFVLLMVAMAIGGTLIFLLHVFKGVEPIFRVEYGQDVSTFLGLTTTNVFVDKGGVRILRYSGFFDEPGTFALFSTFALLINKIYFNNRRHELLLIVLTIFTFSMAFYFTLVFYLLFFYLNRSTMIYFIIFLLIVPIIFVVLERTDAETYAKVASMTIDRFEETKGDISDTNRGDLMAHDYKAFIENPIFGVGPRPGDVLGSNVYAIVAKYGLIGSLFFYSFLIYMLFLVSTMSPKKIFFYSKIIFIVLLSLFHRPELSSVLTLSTFYTIIYYMRTHQKQSAHIGKNEPSLSFP